MKSRIALLQEIISVQFRVVVFSVIDVVLTLFKWLIGLPKDIIFSIRLILFSIVAYIIGVLPVAGSLTSKSGETCPCCSTALKRFYNVFAKVLIK